MEGYLHPPQSSTEPDSELDELAYQVIGAAIAVHRELGPGFLEGVYERALAVELRHRGIEFRRQVHVEVIFRDELVGTGIIDLLVGGRLVVELKACEALHPLHSAQTLSYVRTINERLGLLINFNVPVLREGVRRVIVRE